MTEFTELEPEMLHLLRIFVLCEGRIRDMEAALGVSYPTVKSRLGKLRSALGLAGSESRSAGTSPPPANQAATESAAADNDSDDDKENVAQILSLLEKGEIDYPTALARIRSVRA